MACFVRNHTNPSDHRLCIVLSNSGSTMILPMNQKQIHLNLSLYPNLSPDMGCAHLQIKTDTT